MSQNLLLVATADITRLASYLYMYTPLSAPGYSMVETLLLAKHEASVYVCMYVHINFVAPGAIITLWACMYALQCANRT